MEVGSKELRSIKASMKIRKRDRFSVEIKENHVPVVELDDNDFDEMAVERIYKCIGELPEGYRVISSLYLIEGYDHEEIGTILNVNSSTSRSQLTRAKSKIREIYYEKYGRQAAK